MNQKELYYNEVIKYIIPLILFCFLFIFLEYPSMKTLIIYFSYMVPCSLMIIKKFEPKENEN